MTSALQYNESCEIQSSPLGMTYMWIIKQVNSFVLALRV